MHLLERLFQEDAIIYILLFLLLFFVFLLLSFISRSFKNFFNLITFIRARSLGVIPSLFSFLVSVALIISIILTIFLYVLTRSYQIIERDRLIAVIETSSSGSADFSVQLSSISDGKITHLRRQDLKGDQWAVEGLILKWPDWLTVLGLNTRYRVTQLRCRYLDIQDELKKPASTWVLQGETGSERLLRKIPMPWLVQILNETTPYEAPANHKVFELHTSESGLKIIRRK